MPLQKNQLLTLRIERLSSDGSGVAHSPEGEAVFVPGTAPGDEAQVRIVKDCGRYAFGILDKLLTPSPDRIPVDCAVAGPCGGCSLRHMDYAAELRAKQESVADAFRRIGGLDVPVLDALPSPEVDRYRNKVQFPVGRDKNGAPCIGFYAGRTHRIVPCPDCRLQPGVLNDIGNALCSFFAAHGIQPYDEESGKGLVRHIFLRRGTHSGQIMVCLVCTRPKFPHSEELVTALREQFSDIASVLINVNAKKTNVILGEETISLYGPGYIEDTLCGVPVRLGPLSFYQVNTLAAERLYGIAAEYAQLEPSDVLLDLYCGMGTIGLSMAAAGSSSAWRSCLRPLTAPRPTPSRWATPSPPRAASSAPTPVRPPPASPLRACVLMSSCSTRPARAATKRPFPPSSRCPPAGWSMSAATPPLPQEMPHGSKSMGIMRRRCNRWTFFPEHGIVRL